MKRKTPVLAATLTPAYRLRVAPGIFADGTFALYAVPTGDAGLEYQLAGQFETKDEALEMARTFAKMEGTTFASDEVEGIDARATAIDTLASIRTKEQQEAALKEQLKEAFKSPETLRFRPFSVITEATPHLLAYFALAVFAFSLQFNVPSWVPLVGDWIGNKAFTPELFAKAFPFLLLLATLIVQVRVRLIGLKLSTMRDYVLLLCLKHGWRRDQFLQLFIGAVEASGASWMLKLGELLQKWDPQTLREVRTNALAQARQPDGKADEEQTHAYAELEKTMLDEDFEARIHSLYYLNKEANFRDWTVALHPVFFVAIHRRAVRRMRALLTDGLAGFVYLGICSLPGGDDYRIHRRLFPAIAAYEVLVIGSSLVWAFIKEPWTGILGWAGMVAVVLATVVPMLAWNFQLLVRHRGLPRGMSWEEIQGDMRIIRAL